MSDSSPNLSRSIELHRNYSAQYVREDERREGGHGCPPLSNRIAKGPLVNVWLLCTSLINTVCPAFVRAASRYQSARYPIPAIECVIPIRLASPRAIGFVRKAGSATRLYSFIRNDQENSFAIKTNIRRMLHIVLPRWTHRLAARYSIACYCRVLCFGTAKRFAERELSIGPVYNISSYFLLPGNTCLYWLYCYFIVAKRISLHYWVYMQKLQSLFLFSFLRFIYLSYCDCKSQSG